MNVELNWMNSREDIEKSGKKRIAFIFNHPYCLGGGEISFLELIKTLDKNSFQPLVIVPEAGEIKDQLKLLGFKVLVCPFSRIKYPDPRRLSMQLVNLIKVLKSNNVDLLHVNGSRACFYAGWAGKILRIPVVWHVRESQPDIFLYDALLVGLSDVVVCVSKSVQSKRFSRFGQAFKKKISVVYNGVNTGKFQERNGMRTKIRAKLGVDPDDIFFGLVGNIIPRKAQDFFLRGLATAKETNPNLLAKAVIIGRFLDKKYYQNLQQLVIDLNLQGRVMFQDFSENIIDIFSGLDIFVLSSKSEGFSRSMLEAMSFGLPIIASKIGEIQEGVGHRLNGILVDFNDVEKMAEGILELAGDEKLRKTMGAESRRLAVSQFDLSIHSRAIENIYHNIFTKNL